MKFSNIAVVLCLASLFRAPFGFAEGKFITRWTFSESQLAIKEGGRANTIAIHPGDPNRMFVASESGGLFRSSDRGAHWSHVDSLPVYLTQAVVYVPSNPNILLASAKADFKTINGGGVWRSTDDGATWNQVQLNVPPFAGRLDAFEITVQPGSGIIFVATSRGVCISSDSGATWSYSDVFGNANKKVMAVMATGGQVYAGGPAGVRIASGNPLSAWAAPAADPGAITDIHAFGRSPLRGPHAFVVTAASRLFRTENGGMNWTEIPSAPRGGDLCGGIAFIKADTRTSIFGQQFLDLYLGNRCWMYRLPALISGGTVNFGGSWDPVTMDHADPRDLAFIDGEPALLGSDGGLHKTPDRGATWKFTGGGRAGGYNALQLTEVKGQFIQDTLSSDVYVGTQDNNLWALNVWANVWNKHEFEGFFLEMERRVPTAADSKMTYVACGPCKRWVSGRHFSGAAIWGDAPGEIGAPSFIRRRMWVQPVGTAGGLMRGMAMTDNAGPGQTWRQFAVYPETPRDIAKLGRSGDGDPSRVSIVYQSFRTNELGPDWIEAGRLIRIHKVLFTQAAGTVNYAAMENFGALGVNPTEFAWYQVYGIDPGNAFHLIAPDVVNQRMMESRNGGESWTVMPELTSLVTDNGRLLFRTDLSFLRDKGEIFPIVTAVSFSPQDPRLVLVGTSEGGIFFSNDNGATWRKMEGSNPATYITAFHWTDANTVFVSTYGRGLWKLRNRRIAVADTFDDVCVGTCDVVSNDGTPERPPFAGGVLVAEGRILGVRTENGMLREVFVTPASSVLFTGNPDDPQDDIAITESDGKDLSKVEPLPQPPDGWIVKGVVFAKDDQLVGTVFGDSEMSWVPPVTKEMYEGSTVSPTKGRPYVHLATSANNGVPTALPNEVFELSATDFLGGAAYEVLVNGGAVKGVFTADGNGSFTAKVTAPSEKGFHRVDVRMAGEEKVIDGSVLLVRHEDK